MKTKKWLYKKLPTLALALAILFFSASLVGSRSYNNTDRAAEELTSRIQNRLRLLDGYIEKAADSRYEDELLHLNLPEDMVIYSYVNDSLVSWNNQFPLLNDDISYRHVFYRMMDHEDFVISPLAGITDEISYINIGTKWYLAKYFQIDAEHKIIAGLEIQNSLVNDARKNENGINPQLKLPGKYSIIPLNTVGGSAVEIDDKPLFKIIQENNISIAEANHMILRWFSLAFLVLALIVFLAGHRSLKNFTIVVFSLTLIFLFGLLWGFRMNGISEFFSPTIYADGPIFSSLGALILINSYIVLLCLCCFYIRDEVVASIRRKNNNHRRSLTIYGIFSLSFAIFLAIYVHLSLKSLLLNSNISLELYRWNTNIPYTITVYLSYVCLLFCIIGQLHLLRPVINFFTGHKYNLLSHKVLIIYATLCALYLTGISSYLGFRKEEDRVSVWANRLSVDRDLSLEIQLRTTEESIAYDRLISALSFLEGSSDIIKNRISDYYFPRIKQGYGIEVQVFEEKDRNYQIMMNQIAHSGTPISPGSYFFFVTEPNGQNKYVGIFIYFDAQNGTSQMILTISSNSNQEDRGYYSILGRFSESGGVNLPPNYSYATYKGGRLISYKGNCPYPTYLDYTKEAAENNWHYIERRDSYVNFMNLVNEDELIIISRPKRKGLVYFISFSYLCIILGGLFSILARTKREKPVFKRNYFKARINTILFASSTLILVTLAIISIVFVYQRNEENLNNLMSSKIMTVQALLERQTRNASSWKELNNPDFLANFENISKTTKCDITLYTPGGKVFRTTTPEVFEKMILGSRINENAFYSIKNLHQRFFIRRSAIANFEYWAMYAPLFNDNGELIAIVGTPYTDQSINFRREAFFHAALIINLFILLLIASLLFSTREVNRLFAPLIEIGKKMNAADIHNPEYIVYKREDEITSLVEAYNRMVKDLSESTRQLAQAERDNAWSQMARQVAHEIKNPLTPIKLQLQRLIRLKENGNPAWEERFDEVSAVILEHIDILTETANEFSTFAKLYSEGPVLMDLDRTIKDQLIIFDNKENIRISYLGMEKAMVMAPKPQLIRVFVNLITNAIQAVEIKQKESSDLGEEPKIGRVVISLRNSTKDGYYDIAFDDNGSGVSEENQSKLFTPNFTTKSSGTGLGLAICRNIIEKCEGEIHYQKSFALGGASFIVTIPKIRS